MTWPDSIVEQFQLVDPTTTDETEYYGPFNSLLSELFPHSEHFQISPQFKGPVSPGSIDFAAIYIVRQLIGERKLPVLFMEIKVPNQWNRLGNRASADQQMREQFILLADVLQIPVLYGISALGPRFCIYEYCKASMTLTPFEIMSGRDVVTDTAPAKWWEYNLLEDEGEAAFRRVVEHVKEMCADVDKDKNKCEFPGLLLWVDALLNGL